MVDEREMVALAVGGDPRGGDGRDDRHPPGPFPCASPCGRPAPVPPHPQPPPGAPRGGILYAVGPTPAPPGRAIGAAGPTTSLRMDAYAPRMYEYGVKATIGKGYRNQAVIDSLVKHKAVYLIAVGGLGATLSGCIKAAKVIAYPELGTEALWEFHVEDFPAIVANDSQGRDAYKEGQEVWAKKLAVA